MFEVSDDYKKLLQRIKNRNFGPHNSQRIKDAVSNALKLYIADKDIYGITQNPTEFINFIENYIQNNKKLFSDTEEKIDEFYDFSKRAVEETKYKTENINSISFETSGTSLFQNEIILIPNNLKPDCLSEEFDSKFESSLEKVEIPKDFTIGSVIYFKDYLYMSQKDMKKKSFLENYKNLETSEQKYDNSLEEQPAASESNTIGQTNTNEKASDLWKYTRSALMFYIQSEELINLYNKIFKENKNILTDEEIDHLSQTIQLQEALKELSEEKLSEFAKDNDIRLCDNREKQEKLILSELK